jgi:hypothetical protein
VFDFSQKLIKLSIVNLAADVQVDSAASSLSQLSEGPLEGDALGRLNSVMSGTFLVQI